MSVEYSIIERCKIVKIVKITSKLFQILNQGLSFGLWGWAGFLSVDWLIACSDSENDGSTPNHYIHHHHINISLLTTSSCVSVNRVYQIERAVFRHQCACHGSVIVPACQITRSVPACQRVHPDVLKAQTLCHCARWQQFQFIRLYSWFSLFVCDDIDCFTLSCDGLLAVFVTIYCFIVYFTVYFIVLVDQVSLWKTLCIVSVDLVIVHSLIIQHLISKIGLFCYNNAAQ